jgi:putative hydrolase of the HAD superfamily
MPIKAVLFDMFDTLMLIIKNHDFYNPSLMRMYNYLTQKDVDVSFEEFNQAYIKARDELYYKADKNFEEPHFNMRVAEALKNLGYTHDVSSTIVKEATSEFCEEFMNYVLVDEHAEAVLRRLHGKYRLGLVSNFAIPECVLKLLKTHGIDKLFDIIVVSGAVNKRKPSPEIFENAMKALDVSANETIFVGDTFDADVGGAKAVGMKAIYVERRKQKEIEGVCADQTIKSLKELEMAISRC